MKYPKIISSIVTVLDTENKAVAKTDAVIERLAGGAGKRALNSLLKKVVAAFEKVRADNTPDGEHPKGWTALRGTALGDDYNRVTARIRMKLLRLAISTHEPPVKQNVTGAKKALANIVDYVKELAREYKLKKSDVIAALIESL